MTWQLQEAKQRFSEVVRRAMAEGPQRITRNGREVVVMVASDEFERLSAGAPDLRDFLLSGPQLGDLDIRRELSVGRKVEL